MLARQIVAEIQDHTRTFVDKVTPTTSTCTLRMNATSTGYLAVPDTHDVLKHLEAPGMRAIVWLNTINTDTGKMTSRQLLEGRIGDVSGDGPFGQVSIPVRDDFDMFATLLGWQAPAIGSDKKIATEYARYSGPSDTRALAIITAAAARLNLPWDVAPSADLGTVGTTEMRMHQLADKILEPLTADRLQLRIRRNATANRWTVDVHKGQTFPRIITPKSGVLTKWQWITQQPTLTRVVVGGRGQDVEREFVTVIDHALETQLGTILEGFVNAGSADEGADLTALGWEALTAARGKAAIAATLQEKSWFGFPEAYDVADGLAVQLGTEPVEDVITEVEVSVNAEGVFRAVPKLGLAINDPREALTRTVAGIAKSARLWERN